MTFPTPSRLSSLRRWTRDWSRRRADHFGLHGASALEHWRGRILASMLGSALVFGIPPLLVAIWTYVDRGLWAMIVVDLVAYGTVPYVLFSRRPTYRARAWTFIGAFWVIGALALALAGFRTAGAVWLTMAALCAGMLISGRAGLAVVLANAAFFVALGFGVAARAFPWAARVEYPVLLWVMSGLNTTMLGLLATLSVAVLVNGLEREAEARVRAESERRSSQKLEALGTLVGGVAHDFNNLLAPIVANVELLLSEELSSEQREVLGDIRASADRGRDLVHRLLVLPQGRLAEAGTCDVAEVAREVARIVRPHAGPLVTIDVHTTPTGATCGSASEWHQVVMNLAMNAVQAMPAGGTLTLEVDLVDEWGRRNCRLRVRDTGKGMSPETLARAFDPFFTTKAPHGGTGLGLHTVRGLVRSLGGTVRLESAVGAGTAVTVCVPLAEPAAAVAGGAARSPAPAEGRPLPARPPAAPGIAPPPRATPWTILVVDDEPAVLESTRRALAAMGHTVATAPSAAHAEAWFRDHGARCDLVITDYRMPGRTGPQLIASLRGSRPHLPAVVVSGYAAEAAGEIRALGGATALLAKPYGLTELRSAIDRACPAAAARN
ncbi:MAG: hypothetical protein ABS52_12910 [Gemmatimonadetes bacterium SCN 70-22]|nr:MAG: hypothetical protein ABS52_12910 [Gemmatimonadetes bacterium SCN 70-22]